MRKRVPFLVFVATCSPVSTGMALSAAEGAAKAPPVVRELYVPFDDLNVLLENQPQRVLLSRQEYEDLLAKAKARPHKPAPVSAAILSADYQAVVEQERVRITGVLAVEVLEEGLQAVALDLAAVGLRRADLDGKSAAVGRADSGQVMLFVEGKGLHRLELDLVASLATTTAQQVLGFRIPTPAAASLRMTVPGDVEIKSGMEVISRVFDESAQLTRFELLPVHGQTSIVMTLNSRLLRKERVVVAKGVVVDEVTRHYERLHATFSMAVLHKAVDGFRLALPPGFDVTHVVSPQLARWSVAAGQQDSRVLEIRLREQTTETVVLNVAAIRTSPPAAAWTFPILKVLDVAGEVAVVGLLLEDRMKAEALGSEGLIPIDTSVLNQALPTSVFQAEPGAPQIRPVAAYYAPQSEFRLAATFQTPPPRLLVTTSLLLTLTQKGQQIRGGFTLLPEAEKLFAVDFTVPGDWQVTDVTDASGKSLPIERFAGRVLVRLPQGVAPRQPYQVCFQADNCPAGWLAGWTSTSVSLPAFKVAGAARETGAVAVAVQDDLAIRAEILEQLTPLDENEKEAYGLAGTATNLAYRFDGPSYQAKFAVERVAPRLTAQTYSFLVVKPDVLTAHYEIVYDVEQAKVRRLSLALPASTPETLSIQGLEGVVLKEYTSRVAENVRHWSILLADARRETIRLAVDFQQPISSGETKDLLVPVVRAEDVAHQAGFVAVEGSAELDVKVATKLRKVDIGELVSAKYQPGKRLLGVYSFLGDSPDLRVNAARNPAHDLPSVLVERAELATVLGAQGVSHNAARVLLRSKDQYLEVQLPAGAALWSAQLDGVPAKPQREGQRLLLNLPAGDEARLHDLQFVYEVPVSSVHLSDDVEMLAPSLLLRRSEQTAGAPIPVASLTWHVYVPAGYRVTDTDGTAVTDQVRPPQPAILTIGRCLYELAGGINLFRPCGLARARELSGRSELRSRLSVPDQGAFMGDSDGDGEADFSFGVSFEEGEAARLDNAPAAGRRPAATRPADEKETGQPLVVAGAPIAGTLAQPPAKLPAPKPAGTPAPPHGARIITDTGYARAWALEGVSSLKIELEATGWPITFQNLGADPRVSIGLLNEHRASALAWALAVAVGLWGLRRINRPVRNRVRYVVATIIIATLISLVSGSAVVTEILNPSVIVAVCLVPCYLLVGFIRWLIHRLEPAPRPAGVAAALAVVVALCLTGSARAAEPPKPPLPMVVEITEPHKPVEVPADVILLPYDPASATGIKDVRQMLVPYDKYVELWNRAHPDQRMTTAAPPAPYGLGGGSLRATLQGDDHLLVEAQADVEVYAEGMVNVPLPLENGVLVRADLDGQPAKLGVVRAASPTTQEVTEQQGAESSGKRRPDGVLVLSVSGKGRHHLALAAQMHLRRSGGWRVAQGRLLLASAGTLLLTVPEAQTEVRLEGVPDRSSYLTSEANQTIETALSADGRICVQWRPKVSEGVVDQSLTAQSTALLDVQEEGLRLVWRVALEFRRSERQAFRLLLPSGYLVTQVSGGNVRGWEVSPGNDRQRLDVTLLKPAKDQERFDVYLWRRGRVGSGDLGAFEVPGVAVQDAALHHGTLIIRRSPLLDVRTDRTQDVTRTDLPPGSSEFLSLSAESPLGIRPFAAYRFVTMPFSIRLTASAVPRQISAAAQTILRIGERERSLEARIILDVRDRSLYHIDLLVPGELDLNQVSAPGTFEWAVASQKGRRLLSIILTSGQTGSVPIVISGRLGEVGPVEQVSLPAIEVLDVQRQEGNIVVQTDPAFKVDSANLRECEPVLLDRVREWLNPKQRELARLVLHYSSPGYSGQLRLVPLAPIVRCHTVSNTRVTDRAIEETILLNFAIQQAGIRELSFLLPESMKDARISAPQLRQKTIAPASPDKPGMVRVRLQLQDRVMAQLRVLVENDRLLTAETQRVPIPVVETGQTDQRYALLENAGRDEMVVETQQGLTAMDRQQKEWQTLARILGTQITSAFVVDPSVQEPVLTFKTKDRALVETVGARIGLAQGWMSVDASGTYRAAQAYRVENSTEQFLEIQMPAGAELWTARVAGEPVKPTRSPDPAKTSYLLIPLVKTAAGDLDYEVVLKYGGRLPEPGGMSSVNIPLIRAVNISAELSQMRLYLPDRCRWFDFGGTMTPVEDEAGLAAGVVFYQTKQAERLNRAMRGASSFAQVRAAANLKVLQSEVQECQEATQSLNASNIELQREWESNALTIIAAEQQSEEVRRLLEQTVTADNRAGLNQYYTDQDVTRAGDAVEKGIANFVDDLSVVPPTSQPASAPGQLFDQEWLSYNSLANPDILETQGRVVLRSQFGSERKGDGLDRSADRFQSPAAPRSSPEVVQKDGRRQFSSTFGKLAQQPAEQGKKAAASSSKGKLNQYQDALEAQAARPQTDQYAASSRGGTVSWSVRAHGSDRGRGASGLMGMGGGYGGYGGMGMMGGYGGGAYGASTPSAATQPAMPSGLTSLDVDIPQVGVLYRFTSPRGDATITVRAVSRSFIDSLKRLGWAVLIVVAVWLIFKAASLLAKSYVSRSTPWLILILVGIISLPTGILPIAGLVLIAVGLAMLVRQRISRVQPAARAR